MISKIVIVAAALIFSNFAFASAPECSKELTKQFFDHDELNLSLNIEVLLYEQGEEGFVEKSRFSAFKKSCKALISSLTEEGCSVKFASEFETISKQTETKKCERTVRRTLPWVK